MLRMWLAAGCAALTLSAVDAYGQQEAADAAAKTVQTSTGAMQDELDAFRTGLFTAFNEGRYDEMLKTFVLPDAIAIWEDGTLTKGHAGVLAEFEKLSKIISKIQVDPTIESRLVLDGGNTVVSAGKLRDTYVLKGGHRVALDSVFTVTLVKQDGKWLLASFNGAANAFDNQVIDLETQPKRLWSAGVGALIGLVIGGIIATVLRSRATTGRAS